MSVGRDIAKNLQKGTKGTKEKRNAQNTVLKVAIRFGGYHDRSKVAPKKVPIPVFTSEGFLPNGIFECSLADVRGRFGAFQNSDMRPRLFNRLEELIRAMKAVELFTALVVDGSFVTMKPAPNDIDIIACLRPGHDFERESPIFEYSLLSRRLLRRRFGFDVIVAEEASSLYKTYVEFFSRVRERPDLRKGMLRLLL